MPITTRTLVTSGLASDAFRSRTSDRPSWPQRRAAAVIRDQSQATAAQDPDRWIPYVPTGDGIPPRSADLERRRSVLPRTAGGVRSVRAICARHGLHRRRWNQAILGTKSSWREGDRVQVLTGPFKGFQGTVVQEEGDHPIVCLRIFGRTSPVALKADKLGPDDGGGVLVCASHAVLFRPSTTPPLIFRNRERRSRSNRRAEECQICRSRAPAFCADEPTGEGRPHRARLV
jgi:hypothetical protein